MGVSIGTNTMCIRTKKTLKKNALAEVIKQKRKKVDVKRRVSRRDISLDTTCPMRLQIFLLNCN
jgi:hypothetical protein